jgi:hypothetical protein
MANGDPFFQPRLYSPFREGDVLSPQTMAAGSSFAPWFSWLFVIGLLLAIIWVFLR